MPQSNNERPKRPRGRPIERPLPPRIDASPEDIAKVILSAPPPVTWDYVAQDKEAEQPPCPKCGFALVDEKCTACDQRGITNHALKCGCDACAFEEDVESIVDRVDL